LHCDSDFDRRRSEKLCPPCRESVKWCSGCLTGLSFDRFYSNQNVCIDCSKQSQAQWVQENREQYNERNRRFRESNPERVRDWSLRRKFGLEPGAYGAMLAEQDGKCAICGLVPEDTLNVDHDHSTGAVRELLCGRCNTGLGLFKDDPVRLSAAISYLMQHLPVERK
jgi:hypothetical protein